MKQQRAHATARLARVRTAPASRAMSAEQQTEWTGIYKQYRRAGHGPVYAARIATGIVIDGLPF